ncbi:hypothetical protein P7L95_01280 [Bisgaard Taxon 10/6]|nr:hypothetical protein [Exercitatus varius]MDG2955394.1 hypothetical protein [Exercitatus varius]
MKKEEKKSQKYIESQGNKELLKKQTKEILSSGGEQAIDMGVKQAFSSLMIEVINITFNEVKIIVRDENILDKKSLKQFNNRIKRNIRAFICKVPDILKDSIKGGISGFLSNLFTFIINNFISTAKKIVTMIREGFRAIYRVFKMIFFPPEGMSKTEIWANAIKLLSTTLITTFALTFTDTIAAFLTVNLPILTPIADVIASVFIGIISGLASALISYLIDSLLDKFIDRHDEQMMDMLLEQSEIREKLVTDLITFINTSEKSVQVYTHIIQRNQLICQNFATIENNNTVIHSGISQSVKKIQKVTEQTKSQITKSIETVNSIESSQIDIEIFLANY